MSDKIAVLGCGFLGSIFTEEMCKRAIANKMNVSFIFVDNDKYEKRNAANQQITLADTGMEKATIMAARASDYGLCALDVCKFLEDDGWPVEFHKKAEKSTMSFGLAAAMFKDEGVKLIVDAFDNLEARQTAWKLGQVLDIPVLHLGASQKGTGCVEWSYRKFDQWHLSPLKVQVGEDAPIKKLPPCELAGMRGLGLQTGFAGAKAVAIWLGFDPERTVDLDVVPRKTYMTMWATTQTSHSLVLISGSER